MTSLYSTFSWITDKCIPLVREITFQNGEVRERGREGGVCSGEYEVVEESVSGEGVCVGRECVWGGSVCGEGVCLVRECVWGGSVCGEGVCVERECVW